MIQQTKIIIQEEDTVSIMEGDLTKTTDNTKKARVNTMFLEFQEIKEDTQITEATYIPNSGNKKDDR